MIKLNDYLYSGDTILKILKNYIEDLRQSAISEKNPIDIVHCNFLLQIYEFLEHNDFLTSQSQRLREFYKFMAAKYPFLAFTFKGRIKSLIRAEEKYNGYIVEFIYDYYKENGKYPPLQDLKTKLASFRDIIAYRVVIALPKCHEPDPELRKQKELEYLYEIANELPMFLEARGFTMALSGHEMEGVGSGDALMADFAPYYRDYVSNPKGSGYQSLHITFFDNLSRCFVELQLRTKEMDDFAEIGPANHLGYEKAQERTRSRRGMIPVGECKFFDDAYERVMALNQLQLSEVDVNMFSAYSNVLINDGCGLYRGRQILPYEHLSRFQNDLID